MNAFGRLLTVTFAMIMATAAYVHAMSEVGQAAPSSAVLLRLGLTAEAMAPVVDRTLRHQMSENAAEGFAEVEPLADPIAALAQTTFAADPLNASVIRTIALGSVLHEDEYRARELMQLTARISKRDSLTNLWLAQDYGRRGDMDAMMASFDHALRTSSRTREVAIRPLVNLLADRTSHGPLAEMLDRRPEWESAFWGEFVESPVAQQSAANFFSAAPGLLEHLKPTARTRLYANLKAARQFEALSRVAALDSRAQAAGGGIGAERFISAEQGNPFGWALQSQGNYAARVDTASGELEIDARAGSFGVAAERLFPLHQTYALEISMAEPIPENAKLKLTAACAGAGGEALASVEIGPGERRAQTHVAEGACDFGDLQLSFSVEPGRRDAYIQVDHILLRPT